MTFQKEWLLNPFRRIAGVEALLLGFGIMLLSACIAWPARTHFDGVMDAHVGGSPAPGYVYFLEPFLAWACASLVFLAVAQLGAGSRFRAIDLAGTLALSRAPMLLAAPVGFLISGPVDPAKLRPELLLTAVPLLITGIWTVVLMYGAFRIAVNPKPGRTAVLFTIALVLAEISSKILFSFFYNTIPL